MLEDKISAFMNELSENGKIYFLSKLAGITVGCVDGRHEESTEELMFSTISNLMICSIVEQNMTENDKIMVDAFITNYANIPDNIVAIVNQSIDMFKVDGAHEDFDVMFV